MSAHISTEFKYHLKGHGRSQEVTFIIKNLFVFVEYFFDYKRILLKLSMTANIMTLISYEILWYFSIISIQIFSFVLMDDFFPYFI
jgi:hypothetical protein